MGLYSTVFNGYVDLGDEYVGELQTKDLACVLDEYWLSPKGELYRIEYRDGFELQVNEAANSVLERFEWVPTGEKGALSPFLYTGCLTVYPVSSQQIKRKMIALQNGKVVLVFD